MAKGDRPPDDKGKVKFRFVEFELEGLNSTIEESIKNIVHSMSRSSNVQPRVLSAKSAAPAALLATNGENTAELDSERETELDGEDAEQELPANTAVRPKAQRHYTVPTFLSEVDLDSGEVPFKTFAEQRAPKSDNRKYILIAAWFRKFRDLEAISTDHIYTCNQKMGWKTQKDVGQPFRSMKKKSYFDVAGRNQWKVTHIGLDQLSAAEEEQP